MNETKKQCVSKSLTPQKAGALWQKTSLINNKKIGTITESTRGLKIPLVGVLIFASDCTQYR